MKKGVKDNLVSLVSTFLVIGLLIMSGPARAMEISFSNLPDTIDLSVPYYPFNLEVQISEAELLPLLYTDLIFRVGEESVTCHVEDEEISGCEFLEITSMETSNLNPGFGYGYGYGYGYGFPGFGYGYGYGYGISPVLVNIKYGLNLIPSMIPSSFIGNEVEIEAIVIGGNNNTFSETTSFDLLQSEEDDEDLVEDAKAALIFDRIKGSNAAENQITTNLNLIYFTPENVMIKWESSDNNVLNQYSGKITRPKNGEGNKEITLTATLFKGTVSDTKSFTLTILEESKSDIQAVQEAMDALVLANILNGQLQNSVINNLNLPTQGSDNTKISWSSSNKKIIENSGSVSRPSLDTSVTLTATLTKGIISQVKSFNVIVKGTTDLNELAVAQAKLALTEIMVLNGNIDKDKVIGDVKLPVSLDNHPGITIGWSSSNTSIIGLNGSVTRDANEDKSVTLTATLTKNGKTATKVFELTVKKQVAPATIVAGTVEVNSGVEEILIDNSNVANLQTVSVPATISENQAVTLNLNSLVDQSTKELTTTNVLTLTRATSTVSYSVEIPTGTKITGEADWNGLITLPTVKAEASATIEGTLEVVIEVGSSTVKLVFDKATKLTVPGQAGKNAGYVLNGVFTTINGCTDSQIADPDTLPAEGDCFTTSGSDLIIWTKHFTEFVSYTPSSASASSSGTSSGAVRNVGLGGGAAATTGIEEVREEIVESAEEVVEAIGEQAQEITTQQPEGNEVTGAVVGARSKASIFIGIIAIVFVIIVGVVQGGAYLRKKYKGMYF